MSRGMSREVERYLDRTTGLEGMPVVIHERPGWAELNPPTHAAFFPRTQRAWSYLIRIFRYPAIVWLWITELWWRFALTVATVASLLVIWFTS